MTEPTKRYLLHSQTDKVYYTNEDAVLNGVSLKSSDEEQKKYELHELIEIAQKEERKIYGELLKNAAYKNLLVLSGAGMSKEGTKKNVETEEEEAKDRQGLWDAVEIAVGKEVFGAFIKKLSFSEELKDIEELLSKAYLYLKFDYKAKIKYRTDGQEEKDEEMELKALVSKIEKCIKEECDLVLSGKYHQKFLDKLLNRNLKYPRVKFFTTNYDRIIEQAAQIANITLLDGFSFTMPRMFSGVNFDYDIVFREKSRINKEESFVPKVMHLYKMHGSLDWIRNDNGNVQICSENDKRDRLLIYPASNKYESSYEQPYFEMMSRFQGYLRQENTLLIIVGFSLYDKHISNVILEAVRQNPSFTLLICNYYPEVNGEDERLGGIPLNDIPLKEFTKESNVFVVNEKFSDFVENYPSNHIYYQSSRQGNEDNPI
ncbi:SIR2 family protein [Sunxiuqinia rutila]|uniref:SIR2 family protein n=1 Tax=Sunxiuqinia rutila TaxID=1397841 RepID=UPI003D36DC64